MRLRWGIVLVLAPLAVTLLLLMHATSTGSRHDPFLARRPPRPTAAAEAMAARSGLGILDELGAEMAAEHASEDEGADATAPVAKAAASEDKLPLLLVHSVGGVGTTTFMQDMERPLRDVGLRLNHLNDHDKLKHGQVNGTLKQLCPPAEQVVGCPRQLRVVVYLFGEPVHAVMSLFRRDFYAHQLRKLRTRIDRCPTVTAAGTSMAMTGHELLQLTPSEYADWQLDILGFTQHVADWFLFACRAGSSHTTVFARRDELWRHMPTLASQLGIPLRAIPRRQFEAFAGSHRSEEASMLSAEQLAKLRATYQPLTDLYAAMGDFLIINRTTCNSSEHMSRIRRLILEPASRIKLYTQQQCRLT